MFDEFDQPNENERNNFSREDTPLKPEEYVEVAKDFFRACSAIEQLVDKYPASSYVTQYHTFGKEEQDEISFRGPSRQDRKESYIRINRLHNNPPIGGTGYGSVTLDIDSDMKLWGQIQQKFDLKTPYILELRIHMDDKTREVAEKAWDSPRRTHAVEHNWMDTTVFFDQTGKLHIVSAIPRNLADERPSVDEILGQQQDHLYTRRVETPVTKNKIEIIGMGLNILREAALKYLPEQEERSLQIET